MNRKLPDWSLGQYFKDTLSFVSYGTSTAKDGWEYLAAFLICFAFAGVYIPLSIIWFVLKNGFKVGAITWLLVVMMIGAGAVFLCLAGAVALLSL